MSFKYFIFHNLYHFFLKHIFHVDPTILFISCIKFTWSNVNRESLVKDLSRSSPPAGTGCISENTFSHNIKHEGITARTLPFIKILMCLCLLLLCLVIKSINLDICLSDELLNTVYSHTETYCLVKI